eukprot:6257562-Pyramimonas_sp.AAC.2
MQPSPVLTSPKAAATYVRAEGGEHPPGAGQRGGDEPERQVAGASGGVPGGRGRRHGVVSGILNGMTKKISLPLRAGWSGLPNGRLGHI